MAIGVLMMVAAAVELIVLVVDMFNHYALGGKKVADYVVLAMLIPAQVLAGYTIADWFKYEMWTTWYEHQ
jgi:hypothetical protein